MIIRQSTIRRKYHGNTSYLLGNVDAGTQEFVGMGNRVNEGETRWTDESQMMPSHQGHTSESHKRIAQINRNMSKLKGWTLQSSLLMLWMEKTRVNNQTKIDDDVNLLKTL